jgi:hypothetical protein
MKSVNGMGVKFFMKDRKGRDHLENLGITSGLMLKWILKEVSRNGVD